jgi:hypothetical protein
MGQSKKNNPQKLATYVTQDNEKQNKNTTQYVLETTMHKTNVNKTCALLQTTEVKTNRTSFSCENRNGHHNTELRT